MAAVSKGATCSRCKYRFKVESVARIQKIYIYMYIYLRMVNIHRKRKFFFLQKRPNLIKQSPRKVKVTHSNNCFFMFCKLLVFGIWKGRIRMISDGLLYFLLCNGELMIVQLRCNKNLIFLLLAAD